MGRRKLDSRVRGNDGSREQGFTLIEIIIVVLVFAVMSVMAYGGLNSVLRTRQGIESSMQRTAAMQRTFLRLRSDFQNLRDRPARDGFGDAQAAFTLDRDGVMNLIRGGWRSPAQSGRSSLERVSYRLDEHQLRRASWRVVDLAQESTPTELALLDNVEEIRWRLLDAGGEWRTEWPAKAQQSGTSSANEPPPIAVELTLVTKDWGETRILFRTPVAGLASSSSSGTAGVGTASSAGLRTREGLLSAGDIDGGAGGVRPDPNDPPAETPPPAQDPTPRPEPDDGDTINPTEPPDAESDS